MSKIKLAGKSISEILKRIKRAQRNKRATKNQEKAGLSTKSVKPFNYRAGARDEQIVPVKKQSQKGSSFQPHRVRGKQGAASIKETSEGSAASWRDEMDKYFGDLRPSKFFKKASGGDINTGMKKLSPKQKAIAAKAPPPDKIDAKDFAVLKAEKAKGRGMGLQDESVKPGKVMKANKGKEIKADPTKTITDKGQFVKRRMKLTGSKLPGKIGTVLGIASMMVPAAYAAAKQYKDYKSAKKRDKAKVKKYSDGMSYKDMAPYGGKYAKKKNEMKADASENVKRLTTQPDAYDPEARYLVGEKRRRNSTVRTVRKTTDQVNLREAANKLKEQAGPGFNVSINTKSDLIRKRLIRPKRMAGRMGGGMAKKYSKGGDLRLDYVYDQTKKNVRAQGRTSTTKKDMQETRREEYGAAKDRYPNKMDKRKQMLKNLSRVASPTMSVMKGVYDKLSQSTVRKYSKGTMVKARGCKLGRTRPTKIT
jgi:hypothetical protein